METLSSILVLAALAEALVEYLVRPLVNTLTNAVPALEAPSSETGFGPTDPQQSVPPDRREPLSARDLLLRYLAAGTGIGLAFAYQVDLFTLFGLQPPVAWLGYLVTGIILGRGSNFVHDFAGRWLAA